MKESDNPPEELPSSQSFDALQQTTKSAEEMLDAAKGLFHRLEKMLGQMKSQLADMPPEMKSEKLEGQINELSKIPDLPKKIKSLLDQVASAAEQIEEQPSNEKTKGMFKETTELIDDLPAILEATKSILETSKVDFTKSIEADPDLKKAAQTMFNGQTSKLINSSERLLNSQEDFPPDLNSILTELLGENQSFASDIHKLVSKPRDSLKDDFES